MEEEDASFPAGRASRNSLSCSPWPVALWLIWLDIAQNPFKIITIQIVSDNPPVDLHWFFEISIRTEKKFQLELKKKIS